MWCRILKYSLDLRGLVCPEPVFRVKAKMDTMEIGDILEVVADDPSGRGGHHSMGKEDEPRGPILLKGWEGFILRP